MSILDPFRLPAAAPMGLRADAEAYAASLGLARGTPAWGTAIRDFVLNGMSAVAGTADVSTIFNRRAPWLGEHFSGAPTQGPGANPPIADHRDGAERLLGTALAASGTMQERVGPVLALAGKSKRNPQGPGPESPRPAAVHWLPRSSEEDRRVVETLLPPSQRDRRSGDGTLGGRVRESHEGVVAGTRPWDEPGEAHPKRGLGSRAFPRELTRLGTKYEDRKDQGPGVVSTGQNDPFGGVSYGDNQMSSKQGTVDEFLAGEGKRWANEFTGLTPGTPAFDRKWREVAAREREALEDAEATFMERTHYRVAVDRTGRRTGLDLDSRSGAVRAATWSAAAHLGRYTRLLGDAVAIADKHAGRAGRTWVNYDAVLIQAIYRLRMAREQNTITDPAASPKRKQQASNMLKHRLIPEFRDALDMFWNRKH